MKIKIGIVGSRRRNSHEDFRLLGKELEKLIDEFGLENITFVSGGCEEGGDRFAEIFAEILEIRDRMIIHLPDKSKLPANPKRWDFAKINYARNTLIAQDSDILVALVASDRTGGTEDTVKKFKKIYPDARVILI